MHASSSWGPRPNGPCLRLTRHLVSPAPVPASGQHRPGRRLRLTCTAASQRNLYEVLGISQSASEREIKSAYRKKALKLHPDVNKAPDAQQQFMEAKMAFETLSDTNQRADYDRQLRMGFGSAADWRSRKSGGGAGSSSSSSSWGGAGNWGSYGTGGRRPASQPEDNYSFEDLMRDLDKEVSSWMKEKSSSPGGAGKPKSLLEELEALGGELVDFLEDVAGVKDGKPGGGTTGSSAGSSSTTGGGSGSSNSTYSSSSGTTSSGGKRKSPIEEFDEIWNQFSQAVDGATKAATGQDSNTSSNSTTNKSSSSSSQGTGSSSYSSSSTYSSGAGAKAGAGAGAGASKAKSSEDEIDAMLAELKRKVKREGS